MQSLKHIYTALVAMAILLVIISTGVIHLASEVSYQQKELNGLINEFNTNVEINDFNMDILNNHSDHLEYLQHVLPILSKEYNSNTTSDTIMVIE